MSCLQGELGITGNVGPMGERVRNPDMVSSILPRCPPIHPYNVKSVRFRAWWVSSDLWERRDWQERR